MQHGPIAEEDAESVKKIAIQAKKGHVLVTKWSEVNPVREWTKGEAHCFPVWMIPTAEEMQFFCGGTVDADGKWNEPTSIPSINKSLKLSTLPYKGRYTEYVIVNGSVSARISQAPSEEDTDLLLVKVSKQSVYDSAGTSLSSFTRQVKEVARQPVAAITITGTAKVGTRLVADTTPTGATGVYQWLKKKGSTTAEEIPNNDSAGYTIESGDVGYTISVKFTADGSFSGTATSTETAAVVA